ncbi:MAG: arsenic efflux protein [Bacilli bacterium]|nr:arsenic efflux protein [Bacilli bacterium]
MILTLHNEHNSEVLHIVLHSLEESVKVFAVALVLYFIISFVEERIARGLGKKNRFSPLIASALGLVPQCGFSVVASDLYVKKHITMGTLIALFLACSDEALPILLSQADKENILSIIIIIVLKFVIGFVTGFVVDLLLTRHKHEVHDHLEHCHKSFEEEVHIGCCSHPIEGGDEHSKVYKHILHPLIHSLKIFAYVLGITLLFNTLIHYLGEENINEFLQTNKYLAPLISSLIGVIPNCAASVAITNVYLLGGLSFGACISGLCMNAGLGLVFLFKKKTNIKNSFTILGIMFGVSLFVGYLICFISGF